MRAKRRLLVIAAHHLTHSVASLRFRELVRHFRESMTEVHVITRASDGTPVDYVEADGSVVHALPGGCVGSGLSSRDESLVLAFALSGCSVRSILPRAAWLSAVIDKADQLILESQGQHFAAVVGTYSPIDALIAAKSVRRSHGTPSVLDFRDGFSFESLGRSGIVSRTIRNLVERSVVRKSSLVTTVSRPLVANFESRYKGQRVELLPNGYDPGLFSSNWDTAQADEIAKVLPDGKLIIAHFGRVGASDATRTLALQKMIEALNGYHAKDRVHLLFVGELTRAERALLRKLDVSSSECGPVDRRDALTLMKVVDVLLLITGAGTGCATGKVFEYIAAERPVICFSLVENEASRIMKETGVGVTVLAGDDDRFACLLDTLIQHGYVAQRNEEAVAAYRRDYQAVKLLRLIDELGSDQGVVGADNGAEH